ncbi:MAG: alpha/beta hydrolase [Candidatus Eremiobacteraeota bacterium]|nr:alpha/beta hydrolase [Candidatus Eremiobacteraeota bacterium]MBV8284207.1 alpha/beta hydrolase [Candidatus Eremiobacteraeota bacterium]MBV8434015.1 alpha/beta hydrolase [Candidatus Eremiobacteraeota bacterium]MBV8582440.1 alpha/beta hydrolase [Candidatus Eremiobacteraeota bacterium]MBV8654590.1 alpha/beta hydrolase [Candidatus Eremiobacteraeota bacterium]
MTTSSERLERLLARDHPGVGDKGRTIAYLYGERRPRAVVLLHGLSASPLQFDRYARELHQRGHNVVVPRLPRHGHADRLSTALERLRPDELYEATAEYVALAAGLGDRVTIAGFSLGGLLAAWAGQHFAVDRAVAIAPFFGVAWIPGFAMSSVAELMLAVPNRFHWWNPVLRERQMPEHGYPRFSTHAVAHSFRVAARVMREAGQRPPRAGKMVLVTNAREATVNNRAIRVLYRRWRALPSPVDLLVLRGLPLSHDVIEPLRRSDLAERAYPFLLNAIDPGQGQS